MRVLPVVLATVLLAAAPAAAAPVTLPADGLVAAGPELDGNRVVWGEEQRGQLVVRTFAGGVVADGVRQPALDAPRTRRFGQLGSPLAAAPTWLGFVERTETADPPQGEDSGSGSSTSVVRAGAAVGGEPPVVPVRPGAEATAVAAHGPVLAVADARFGAGARVVVRSPEAPARSSPAAATSTSAACTWPGGTSRGRPNAAVTRHSGSSSRTG